MISQQFVNATLQKAKAKRQGEPGTHLRKWEVREAGGHRNTHYKALAFSSSQQLNYVCLNSRINVRCNNVTINTELRIKQFASASFSILRSFPLLFQWDTECLTNLLQFSGGPGNVRLMAALDLTDIFQTKWFHEGIYEVSLQICFFSSVPTWQRILPKKDHWRQFPRTPELNQRWLSDATFKVCF